MFVCLCYGVTEKKIKQLQDDGAKTVREIQKRCHAGTSCGSCIGHLNEIVRENESVGKEDPSAAENHCSQDSGSSRP